MHIFTRYTRAPSAQFTALSLPGSPGSPPSRLPSPPPPPPPLVYTSPLTWGHPVCMCYVSLRRRTADSGRGSPSVYAGNKRCYSCAVDRCVCARALELPDGARPWRWTRATSPLFAQSPPPSLSLFSRFPPHASSCYFLVFCSLCLSLLSSALMKRTCQRLLESYSLSRPVIKRQDWHLLGISRVG